MPQLLKQHGVHSHLISDHYHYWEDGGCDYHTKYQTWEIARGQEGDPWKADLRLKEPPRSKNADYRKGPSALQDWVNRAYMEREEDQPQPTAMRLGEEFLRTNAA